MGESNQPLRMARSAFSGRKTGSGLNGRKVGVHWRRWISVMDLFRKGFSKFQSKEIQKYEDIN